MNKRTEIKNNTKIEEEIADGLMQIAVKGSSMLTKTLTFRVFRKVIDQFGVIYDFNSNKDGIVFFIETDSYKIQPLIKKLKDKNCFIDESTVQLKASTNTNSIKANQPICLYIREPSPLSMVNDKVVNW